MVIKRNLSGCTKVTEHCAATGVANLHATMLVEMHQALRQRRGSQFVLSPHCTHVQRWPLDKAISMSEQFCKLRRHYREVECMTEFDVLRTSALEYYVMTRTNQRSKVEEQMHNKECWRVAISKCNATHDVNTGARVTARYLNHTSSSCSNERDIKVLCDYLKKNGSTSMRTLHDLVCVVRYGPKTIAELFSRELSVTGSVTLIPTAYMQRVRELRLKLFGRRHCINAK